MMSDSEKPSCSSHVQDKAEGDTQEGSKQEGNDQEGDNQEGICLDDYIKAQADLEEDAQAVLGASDANNCTYDQVEAYCLS